VLVVAAVMAVCVLGDDWDVRAHMASMTTYDMRQCPRAEEQYQPPEGCQLVSYDMVLRHGSRFPTDKNIDMINGLYDLIQENADHVKMEWMKTWTPKFNLDDQGLLCPRGVAEHRELGANVSRDFKDAVLPYNANEVLFTCTYKDRTSQSAEAFGNAMVNDDGATPIAVTSNSKPDDTLLRFFDNCPRYSAEVHDNPEAYAEADKWIEKNLDSLIESVADRTGLPVDTMARNESFFIIDSMWSACQSEYVVLDIADQWCSVFSQDDVRVLEFYDDLSAYYVKSYGHDINYLIAAPLLADIINNMKSSAEPIPDDFPVRANLRFGHAETILPLSALLGLFRKDGEVLAANMTNEEIDARTWRFSATSPLASNIAFAQYRCDGQDETQVELLYNGVTYPIRGCGDSRLCPLSTLIDSFNYELHIAETFQDYCAVNQTDNQNQNQKVEL